MAEEIEIPQIKPKDTKTVKNENVPNETPIVQESSGNQDVPINQTTEIKKKPWQKIKINFKKFNFKNPWVIGVGVLLVILTILTIQSLLIFSQAKRFISTARKLKDVAATQDITAIKSELQNTKSSLKTFHTSVKSIFWIKPVPFIGSYVKDADNALGAALYIFEAAEITIQTAEPYLNILGFDKGEQAEDGEKTTQERIDFVVKAIPDLIPQIDSISEKVKKAQDKLAFIDPDRYPKEFKKQEIREPLRDALELFDEASSFITKSKPLLEAVPYLLGIDEGREYLVLFQNDTELRPTGGFLTGYSIMDVEKAKFDSVFSNDIYNLDAKYTPNIEVPEPLARHIKQPYGISNYIRLRDMNWSPDFATSMGLFLEEAEKAGLREVDGVIAVDTQTLVNFLDAIGPIGVPGYGNFSAENEPACNCPQVIYELEKYADVEGPIVWFLGKIVYQPANADNRKRIIGPLMNSVLANALGQPKEKLPDLFDAAFKSLVEKHVLFYLNDPKAQEGVESFGIAGQIVDYSGDYLHINDANLAGRKSNLYVTQEVDQKIEVEKGEVIKTLTITYKNPEKQDGWLNVILPNWVRVYVPKGSQLIAVEGLEEKEDPYEELGKTVFAGFFELRPEGVAKVTFKYKLPFEVDRDLPLLIQKQPGTKTPLYSIETKKETEEFFLKTDKELKLRI